MPFSMAQLNHLYATAKRNEVVAHRRYFHAVMLTDLDSARNVRRSRQRRKAARRVLESRYENYRICLHGLRAVVRMRDEAFIASLVDRNGLTRLK